jgi:hypothetical protein
MSMETQVEFMSVEIEATVETEVEKEMFNVVEIIFGKNITIVVESDTDKNYGYHFSYENVDRVNEIFDIYIINKLMINVDTVHTNKTILGRYHDKINLLVKSIMSRRTHQIVTLSMSYDTLLRFGDITNFFEPIECLEICFLTSHNKIVSNNCIQYKKLIIKTFETIPKRSHIISLLSCNPAELFYYDMSEELYGLNNLLGTVISVSSKKINLKDLIQMLTLISLSVNITDSYNIIIIIDSLKLINVNIVIDLICNMTNEHYCNIIEQIKRYLEHTYNGNSNNTKTIKIFSKVGSNTFLL